MRYKLLLSFLLLILSSISCTFSQNKPNLEKLGQNIIEMQHYMPIYYKEIGLVILDAECNRDTKTVTYTLQTNISEKDISNPLTHTNILMMLLPMLGIDIRSWTELDYQISVHFIDKEFTQEAYIKYDSTVLNELFAVLNHNKKAGSNKDRYSTDYTNSLVLNLAKDYGICKLSTKSMMLEFKTNYIKSARSKEIWNKIKLADIKLTDDQKLYMVYRYQRNNLFESPSDLSESQQQIVDDIIKEVRELKNEDISKCKITAIDDDRFLIRNTFTEEESNYLEKSETREDEFKKAEAYYKELLGSSYGIMQSVSIEFYNTENKLIHKSVLK